MGLTDITTGLTDLGHGVVNGGLQLTIAGLDMFFVELPETTVFGAVSAFLSG